MDNVKTWAFTVCVAALVCTAVQMLVPKTGTGKVFRMVMAAAFLLCMIGPLADGISLQFPQFDGEINADTAELEDTLEQQLCRQIETAVRQCCEEEGFSAEKVQAITDISSDGSIYMKQILIYTDKQDAQKALLVKRYLEQDTDITVEVIVAEPSS